MTLPAPPRGLARLELQTVLVRPSSLWRVTRRASDEPYFGRTGANRFDDPSRSAPSRFGTCYLGTSLLVAIAETVLHDEMPVGGRFFVAHPEVAERWCVRFRGGQPLTLANLTGAPLKALVGSGALSTVTSYEMPQRWSRALHRHPGAIDGLLYMSRHVNDEAAVVVFDRAAQKLGKARYAPLLRERGVDEAISKLHIDIGFA